MCEHQNMLKKKKISKDCFAALAIMILISLIFLPCQAFAQYDTSQKHGTIKIGKTKDGNVYIKAIMNFDKYDLSKVDAYVTNDLIYPPFPGVEGYTFPFNYTKYFNEEFKAKTVNLEEKSFDTVRIEIKVLASGKVYITDKNPSVYNEQMGGIEKSRLQINSLFFLKKIKTWEPAYITIPKKDKFKKQTVIKPEITPLTASGILTILFSTAPFEE